MPELLTNILDGIFRNLPLQSYARDRYLGGNPLSVEKVLRKSKIDGESIGYTGNVPNFCHFKTGKSVKNSLKIEENLSKSKNFFKSNEIPYNRIYRIIKKPIIPFTSTCASLFELSKTCKNSRFDKLSK